MPTQFTGRVTLIVAVVLLALWMIFPRGDFRHPDLKPGIDMVGGTSLLYEIKPPEGGWSGDKSLAEAVMESLKKRVDPSGVRNLIWRPQGNSRLEIQMPLTATSAVSKQRKDAFAAAESALEATNIRTAEVTAVVEDLKGSDRANRLSELEMGSASRKVLFDELAKTWDQIQAARAEQNAARQAESETRYDELKSQIERTNLSSQQFQEILDAKPASRDQKLAELKQRFADFPRRLAAMEDFQQKYTAFAEVKGAIDDAGELKRLLRGSGVLEFHILATPPAIGGAEATISDEEFRVMAERLLKDGPQVRAGDTVRWFLVDKPEEFRHQTVTYNDKHYVLAYITSDMSMANRPGVPRWGLKRAYPDNSEANRKVGFEFDGSGSKQFGDLTGRNVGRPLGIVLDDKMISAPRINQQIHGSGVITGGGAGGFTAVEQRYLISTLNAGSLPAQLTEEPISERTVGPQLGEDNLRAGLMASIIGLIAVSAFMIIYYHILGMVAVVALMMNMLFILGFMSALNATWTLPAVAGIVLTIGMAVDANVLIYERLREETTRGLSLRMALRNAYSRAFSAILDSNVVTAITCVILYWVGSEEVKGFGLTLLIGIMSSMFTALFVTKTILGIMLEKFGLTRLGSLPQSVPAVERLLHPKINWMTKAKYFVAFSVLVTVVGLVAIVLQYRKGVLLDIEFASGTSVQFELKQPMDISEVRRIVEKADPKALPSPNVVTVGDDRLNYEVTTPNPDGPAVKRALLAALQDKLKLEVPSDFDSMGEPLAAVLDSTVLPIKRDFVWPVAGMSAPRELASHTGGAAIILKNLNPPLTAAQVRQRIESQRLQPQPGEGVQPYRKFDVIPAGAPDQPAATVVVLVSDPAMSYTVNADQWATGLAQPMWKLINDGIHKPAELQKVINFDASVAGDMQRDALMALVLSVLVIMAYIWIRFGNLKYGTATVVAMVHDTLLVIAAVGLSHWVGMTTVGQWLLVEPLRVNLTIVAAVLTVMGYSMVDTIVVFDRIRENRGKFGHLDSRIVNDSINQTLSRTLLTAGTTLLTVTVMYIFGGPGIHGFTFVMLVGILAGTYSSIAIAAPILLVGAKKLHSVQPVSKPAAVGQLQRA